MQKIDTIPWFEIFLSNISDEGDCDHSYSLTDACTDPE